MWIKGTDVVYLGMSFSEYFECGLCEYKASHAGNIKTHSLHVKYLNVILVRRESKD